ncbi:transcription elongation GreA/GreB family factor [Bradyrhizobium sp. GM0.4]
MSVAFTKEESAETAAETLLPDRPISPHPNLVTEAGLQALQKQLQDAREAYEAAQAIEDVNEKRRQSAVPLRDARYLTERLRTAQVIPAPASTDVVAFGSTVTFSPAPMAACKPIASSARTKPIPRPARSHSWHRWRSR